MSRLVPSPKVLVGRAITTTVHASPVARKRISAPCSVFRESVHGPSRNCRRRWSLCGFSIMRHRGALRSLGAAETYPIGDGYFVWKPHPSSVRLERHPSLARFRRFRCLPLPNPPISAGPVPTAGGATASRRESRSQPSAPTAVAARNWVSKKRIRTVPKCCRR